MFSTWEAFAGPPLTCKRTRYYLLLALAASAVTLGGCAKSKADPAAEAPPPPHVERVSDADTFSVEQPSKFRLVTAEARATAPELNANGVVQADVSRTVPVVSLSSGRVVEVLARLGDRVQKGQLLMKVRSADVASAYADHQKAVADEKLAAGQLARARLLYDKGALALRELEIAEDAENKAKVDVENTAERLRVLGASAGESGAGVVDIKAPVSGFIIEQNVTNAAGVKSLDNSPNLFTIADLARVWIVCDVYQDDLPQVQVGQFADIHLDAYPGKVFHAHIGDIGPVLDPTLRTAKVRLELANPGLMRVGMFVRATFHGKQTEQRALVPATAVLHLHDRDWVYVPSGEKTFRRLAVKAGTILPDHTQIIQAGLEPGQQVVADALQLQTTVEQ